MSNVRKKFDRFSEAALELRKATEDLLPYSKALARGVDPDSKLSLLTEAKETATETSLALERLVSELGRRRKTAVKTENSDMSPLSRVEMLSAGVKEKISSLAEDIRSVEQLLDSKEVGPSFDRQLVEAQFRYQRSAKGVRREYRELAYELALSTPAVGD